MFRTLKRENHGTVIAEFFVKRFSAGFRPKEAGMLPIHTILHPTDFSERSQYAFWLACSLARDYGARLIVLHVVALPTVVYGEAVVVPPNPEELRAAAQVDERALGGHSFEVERDPDAVSGRRSEIIEQLHVTVAKTRKCPSARGRGSAHERRACPRKY